MVVRLRGALLTAAVLTSAIFAGAVAPADRSAAGASGGASAPATTAAGSVASAIDATADPAASIRRLHFPGPSTVLPRLDAGDPAALVRPDIRFATFSSEALARTMPYAIYLPPGYDTSTQRYPVLYMLHGMSGTNDEWRAYGILDAADRMIRSGAIRPLIIVLPQGDKAYWVDHELPTDREAWGRYTAADVVANVDARFRTVASSRGRAIGGVSMGAHGAVQLAMTYPGVFSVVGAHSLVLRRFDSAPAYFGSQADWAKHDPMQLAYAKADTLRGVDLWIDIGSADPWSTLARQFDAELSGLGIAHQWHEWSGDHSASYWTAHLADYLRFYDASLTGRLSVGAAPTDRLL